MATNKEPIATTVADGTTNLSIADMHPEVTAVNLNDNIADDITSDDHLAQFIQDIENTPVTDTKFPSVADLYMKHISNKSSVSYLDEVDEIATPSRVLDGVSGKLTVGGKTTYFNTIGKARDLYQHDVNDYGKFHQPKSNSDAISKPAFYNESKWVEKNSANYRNGKDFLDDDYDDPSVIESAVDQISDRVDTVYDCVKSIDQQVNNLYEKSLGVGDAIEEIHEQSMSQTLHICNINNQLDQIAKKQIRLETVLDEMIDLMRKIHANTLSQ